METDSYALAFDEHLAQYAASKDVVGVVNRGHQYVQKALRALIKAYVARPDAGLRYQKVKRLLGLAGNLGLLTEREQRLLDFIDKLRDKVDHDGYIPQEADQKQAWSLMLAALENREISDTRYRGAAFPDLLASVMMYAHDFVVIRSRQAAQRRLPDLSHELYVATHQGLTQFTVTAAIMITLRDHPHTVRDASAMTERVLEIYDKLYEASKARQSAARRAAQKATNET
jgi:hypothetical protein